MANTNESYLEWLKFLIDYQGRYHNHKETMAWVATALYIPAIIYLSFLFRLNFYTFPRAGTTVLFVAITWILWLFVNWQFGKLWTAYLKTEVLRLAVKRVLPGAKQLAKKEREVVISDALEEEWPEFIARELANVDTGRGWRQFIKAFQCLWPFQSQLRRHIQFLNYGPPELADPLKSETASYLAIAFAFITAIAIVWSI